jgi:hypothetical protein
MFIPMVPPGVVNMGPYAHLVNAGTQRAPGSPSKFAASGLPARRGQRTPHGPLHAATSTPQRLAYGQTAQTPLPKPTSGSAPPTPFDSLISAIDRARREDNARSDANADAPQLRKKIRDITGDDGGGGTDEEEVDESPRKARTEMSALDVLADQAASASKSRDREREREKMLAQVREGSPTPTRKRPGRVMEDEVRLTGIRAQMDSTGRATVIDPGSTVAKPVSSGKE